VLRGGQLFEAEAARQGRGSGGGRRMEGMNGEEGGGARPGVGQRGNNQQRLDRGARG
jgi:hypothetical protein